MPAWALSVLFRKTDLIVTTGGKTGGIKLGDLRSRAGAE